jgi:hypothetical protein
MRGPFGKAPKVEPLSQVTRNVDAGGGASGRAAQPRLKDIYYAEKRILKALPEMAKHADSASRAKPSSTI